MFIVYRFLCQQQFSRCEGTCSNLSLVITCTRPPQDETRYPSDNKPTAQGYDGSFQAYVNLYDRMALSIAQDPAARITGKACGGVVYVHQSIRHAFLYAHSPYQHINSSLQLHGLCVRLAAFVLCFLLCEV